MDKIKIIDITQELFSCRVYPGDKPPTYERVKTVARDKYNLTNISMSVHNGTHIDAPKHFIAGGNAVHELDLSVFYGKCTVVEFEGIIGDNEIAGILKNCRKRLLFKGRNELTENAAALIANSQVKLIGVESQSVGNIDHPLPVHVILLKKGIIPLEGLNLSNVDPGEYILSAFPLNMQDSDGSPVRAVLIDENKTSDKNP
ncbi:MAG: cyclase family protein [Oscillospiraceae bacterium]|nr:cyclase family protein [Oscillospiraceae bacterium]